MSRKPKKDLARRWARKLEEAFNYFSLLPTVGEPEYVDCHVKPERLGVDLVQVVEGHTFVARGWIDLSDSQDERISKYRELGMYNRRAMAEVLGCTGR